MKHIIPDSWFDYPKTDISHILLFFDSLVENLVDKVKVPKYAYSVMSENCIPEKQIKFWSDLHDDLESDLDMDDWEKFISIILNAQYWNPWGHFISKFSIEQLLLMNFFLK